MSCIDVSHLSKVYGSDRGEVEALRDVSTSLGEGEFVSIVGPSGCGKSTLMRCIAGLESFTSGAVRVLGKDVTRPLTDVGIVFQRDVLLDWRRVLGNVLLPAEFRYGEWRSWEARARALLAKLGLAEFADRYPWELSGGMRQRVAICRALLDDPGVLLMDEPFGALDAMTRDELNVELQRIWSESAKSVIFITHSITEAVFLSDRVLVMAPRPGRIIDDVRIDLPRPRDLSVRETEAFGRYSQRIRGRLQETSAWKH